LCVSPGNMRWRVDVHDPWSICTVHGQRCATKHAGTCSRVKRVTSVHLYVMNERWLQAAVFRDYGAAADVVSVDNNAALPAIGPTDVVIRVRASAINPVDFKIIKGVMRLISPWVMPHPPRVPGCDCDGFACGVHVHSAALTHEGDGRAQV